MLGQAQQGTVPSLNMTQFQELAVFAPPLRHQHTIAGTIADIEANIWIHRAIVDPLGVLSTSRLRRHGPGTGARMTPLTAMQLAGRLIDSLQALGGNADTSEVIGIVSAMLVIKRSVDQPGPIAVHSSDPLLEVARVSQPTEKFTRLIKEVETDNPRLLDGADQPPFPKEY